MSDVLASFRELKGIGPATEAKLHEAGVYTWAALAEVETALGSVRGSNGDTLRDLSAQIADRASAAGGATAPRCRAPRHGITSSLSTSGTSSAGGRRIIDLVVSTT